MNKENSEFPALRVIFNELLREYGTQEAIASAINMDPSKYSRLVTGSFPEDLRSVLKLAGWTLVRNDVYRAVVIMSSIGQKTLAKDIEGQ